MVDLRSGRGSRITVGGGVQLQSAESLPTAQATGVAVAPGLVATLVVADRKSTVTFYRLK